MLEEIFLICATVFPVAALASLGTSIIIAVYCDAKAKAKAKNIKKKSLVYQCKHHQRRWFIYNFKGI